MKVLLIIGSPHEKGCTYTALTLIAGELNSAGIETEILKDRKSTRLNSSHYQQSRMPSSA